MLQIVFLPQVRFSFGNLILSVLLPIKLLPLGLTQVLYLLALVLKPSVCLIINLLGILHILFALVLRVVVHFEGTLRAQKVRVGLAVEVGGDLLAVEGEADDGADVVFGVMHICLAELIQALVLSVQVVGCQVESVHVFLAAGEGLRWCIVDWGGTATCNGCTLTILLPLEALCVQLPGPHA